MLTKEETQAAEGSRAKVIDVEQFVDADQIDPVFYDHPYYIGPQDGGEHAYEVVRKALEQSNRVGIGRFVLRTKEQLVALRPLDGVLGLSTVRFHDELVEPKDVDIELPKKTPRDREVQMAGKLVESLAAEFQPDKWEDTYRNALLEIIDKKARGEAIEAPAPAEAEETDDLMAALEASLAGAGKD